MVKADDKWGPEITVWVVDHTAKKWPVKIQMRHDIRLLRHRVMRLPFIEHIQAAWLVHGGSSVMLRWNTIDKWYGTKVVRYLEDGDTVEDAELYNGALIQPVLDDGEYGLSAFKINIQGMVMSLFR